uniref:Uncharacterized protein n=1 Tax=Cannabis sativa TaxID=3483 RepID=A0A803PTL6_CANSA
MKPTTNRAELLIQLKKVDAYKKQRLVEEQSVVQSQTDRLSAMKRAEITKDIRSPGYTAPITDLAVVRKQLFPCLGRDLEPFNAEAIEDITISLMELTMEKWAIGSISDPVEVQIMVVQLDLSLTTHKALQLQIENVKKEAKAHRKEMDEAHLKELKATNATLTTKRDNALKAKTNLENQVVSRILELQNKTNVNNGWEARVETAHELQEIKVYHQQGHDNTLKEISLPPKELDAKREERREEQGSPTLARLKETIPHIFNHLRKDVDNFAKRVKAFDCFVDEYLETYDGEAAIVDDGTKTIVEEAENSQAGDNQTSEVVDILFEDDNSLSKDAPGVLLIDPTTQSDVPP